MEPGGQRITFLLLGLMAGLVCGAAIAWHFRAELDDVNGRLARLSAEADGLRMERDALTTKLAAAEQRATTAELDLRRLEDMPVVAPTPEERAEREAREKAFEAEQERKKRELLQMLTGGGEGAEEHGE